MHELSIAKNIIRIAGEHLSPDEQALLTKIRVRIGKFSTIVPDLLQSGFEAAVDGTAMENAKLEITVIPLRVQCNSCGEVSEIEPVDFTCPVCCSNDVDVVEGNEIMIENLEITEPINH
ncbi:hydrogenase maturation nickel metallochaperone HypA [Rhodohalobacter sulfatireducens]|uniref:Hydrogenase maturation factor HypA n=1 Tax=Rhodohalobacter sulfatireducens TaxID=2911366 RepID=A0ABS9KD61_9BACT|nr:hydrogenase maturation nickel metallochaperone HypA [Rhodohalobacter sulfatireducens]MCG2588799.1 hydrogenase maturation nickel metallochaperone HypA [Rhodohalobacter sulfatireducens]